jgi:hypothetical protein
VATFTQYTAYFDASGHPDDSEVMYVAGFVASEEKWQRWETVWLALLEEFGIQPPFHCTEFEARKEGYADWSDKRREDFRLKAVRTFIPPRLNKAISYGIRLTDLRRIHSEFEFPPHLRPEPYPWCGTKVVELVMAWASRRWAAGDVGPTDRYAFVFEHGDKHRGLLEKALDHYGLLPIFMKKGDVVAFQACDFLAWQHRNWLTKRDPTRRRASETLQLMARSLAKDSLLFHTYERMVPECERLGFPRRQ